MSRDLSDADYQQLLVFRDGLRQFLHWSEQHALEAGITPAQHQLLLAIRGHPGGTPTISDAAEHLLLRHHSVVGLVDRAVLAGLVERHEDPEDRRVVRLRLTTIGTRRLAALVAANLEELNRLVPVFASIGRSATAPGRRITDLRSNSDTTDRP